METRREQKVESRFKIEKLEERIAPHIAPGLLGYEGHPGNQGGQPGQNGGAVGR